MKMTTTTIEKLIIGLTVFFIGLFAVLFLFLKKSDQHVSQSEIFNINYEMAKAKDSEKLYSLDGRDIEHEFTELDSANQMVNGSTHGLKKENSNNSVAKKNESLKSAENLKKINNQPKTQVNPEDKWAMEQKKLKEKAEKEKIEFNKKQASQIEQQKSINDPLNSESKPGISTGQSHFQNENTVQFNESNVDKNISVKNPKDLKNIKTISLWTEEIMASSDRQIILKLVSAYRNNEVKTEDFYNLVGILLNSNREEKKGFGVYALRATPSYLSYSLLIKTQQTLPIELKSYAQEALLSYHQTSELLYLKQALGSSEKIIISKTLEILTLGFNDIKIGNTAGLIDSRYRRDTTLGKFSIQSYQSFLPILTDLQSQFQQAGDQDLFNSADQLFRAIQATSQVALN